MKNLLLNPDKENSIDDLKSLLDYYNQMELSVSLAMFFDIQDLINILDSIVIKNASKRDITKEVVTLFKYETIDGQELVIEDILYLNHSPAMRFIQVTTRTEPTVDFNRFKYKYYPDIYSLLCKIIADSINYNNFCKMYFNEWYKVKRKHLYVNFAQAAIRVLKDNYKILIEFKYIMNTLLESRLFNTREKFYREYKITDYIKVELITITLDIVKFSVTNNDKVAYIYLDRNMKGRGTLKLILELMLRHRRYPYY